MGWGEPEYCHQLLGDAFDLEITTHNTPWQVETPEELWEDMSEGFGPIKTLLGRLSPDPAEAFRSDMFAFLDRQRTDDGIRLDRVYNLVTGKRKT